MATTARLSGADLLDKINSIFEAFALPRWEALQLGDTDNGECRIIDMIDFTELGPRRIEMKLLVDVPGVGETTVRVRFGGRLVMVIPYLVVDQAGAHGSGASVALCKRWRVENGEWSYELPKGIEHVDPAEDAADPFDSPSHRVLGRIFGQLCIDSLTAAKVIPVGPFTVKGESEPGQAYILVAEVRQSFPRRKGDGEIVLLKWPQVINLIKKGRGITDLSTVAVLLRAAHIFKFI